MIDVILNFDQDYRKSFLLHVLYVEFQLDLWALETEKKGIYSYARRGGGVSNGTFVLTMNFYLKKQILYT